MPFLCFNLSENQIIKKQMVEKLIKNKTSLILKF